MIRVNVAGNDLRQIRFTEDVRTAREMEDWCRANGLVRRGPREYFPFPPVGIQRQIDVLRLPGMEGIDWRD